MAGRSPKALRKQTDERRGGMRPVAAALPKIAAKAIGKRGFAEATLLTDWDRIVGRELAKVSQPEKLSFPPGERSKGTLHIRVQGGVATELQHLEPQVIERINGHFGYGAVARLKLTHAPLQQPRRRRTRLIPPSPPPTAEQRGALDKVLAEVEDPEVKQALERLGKAILNKGSEVKKT